jgi:hypothetical protein
MNLALEIDFVWEVSISPASSLDSVRMLSLSQFRSQPCPGAESLTSMHHQNGDRVTVRYLSSGFSFQKELLYRRRQQRLAVAKFVAHHGQSQDAALEPVG